MAESAVQGVIRDAELLVQAAWTENRNSGGVAVDCPALPDKPQVKIENAWCVGQCRHNFALDRNSMGVDLVVKGLTERNLVPLVLDCDSAIVSLAAEPEFYMIEEVEACPVDELVAGRLIFGPEEDGGCKDTFESVFNSSVVEAIGLKAEEGEHLSGALKADDSVLLFEGERCDPNGDEPVLPEGQTIVGVTKYVKEKLAAVPRMCQLIFRRSAQWEPAHDEWPGVEGKLLPAACSLLTNQADGFYLLKSPLGDAKSGKDFANPREGRMETMLDRAWTTGHKIRFACASPKWEGESERLKSRAGDRTKNVLKMDQTEGKGVSF